MPIKKNYFYISIAIALLLCAMQIRGSTMLILMCLAVFLALIGWCCTQNFTLPILLFFLPWSPLLRTSPNNFSFYTFGVVLVCAISVFKNWSRFKRYHIAVGVLLLFLTLLSKLLDGSSLSFDYIAFMMLIVLFPVVKEEQVSSQYDYFQVIAFFSAGVIVAALCAQRFAAYPNIAKYIRVDSYLTITRMCGFYGDPNFYTAQITAALSGCLVMILKETVKPRTVFLGILLVLLLYCGFLSGSKSFALISAAIVCLWIIELLRMRGRTGTKIALIISGSLVAAFIASSALFSGLIDVLITRFSYANNISDFTTGRTDLWQSYVNELLGDAKLLLLGKGFTNVKVNGRASHNTILQFIFQLGLLGTAPLVVWIVCFFTGIPKVHRLPKKQRLNLLILLLGTFGPWLAIDALFFDEFFLFQWYTLVGLQQLCWDGKLESMPEQRTEARLYKTMKRPRIRIVWQ